MKSLRAFASKLVDFSVTRTAKLLLLAFVILSFAFAVWLESIGSNLRSAAPSVRAPWTAIQQVDTVEKAKILLSKWTPGELERVRFGLYLDFLFPVAYAGLLIMLSAWSGRDAAQRYRRWAPLTVSLAAIACLLVVAAALLDWFENAHALKLVSQFQEGNPTQQTAGALAAFAKWKWLLLKVWLGIFAALFIVAWLQVLSILRVLCWLWLLRVPLVIGFLLALLPTLAEGMTRGAFDGHQAHRTLFLLGLVLGCLVFSIWRTTRLILCFGDERANVPDFLCLSPAAEDRLKKLALVGACLAILPAFAKVLELTIENERSWRAATASISGGMLGAVLLASVGMNYLEKFLRMMDIWMAANIQKLETPAETLGEKITDWLLTLLQKTSPRIWEGYFDFTPHGTFLRPEQLRASLFAVVSVAVFIFFALLPPLDVPAFLYVALLLTAACWVLASVSFFADRFRIPVLVPVFLWVTVWGLVTKNPVVFTAEPWPTNIVRAAPHDFLRPERAPTPVVVAVCGGGIHSGAWGTYVLTELDRYTGGQLSSNIVCVSGISGGSYGLMHFLSGYTNGSVPLSEHAAIRERSRKSSLAAVIHGLVCRDIPRAFVPFIESDDRGKVMEKAWAASFAGSAPPTNLLSTWAIDAKAGRRPALLFGTTSIESGRAVTFSTSQPWTNSDPVLSAMDLNVPVVTAARMSATFPFVSPVARPSFTNQTVTHLGDGGYYDNYGVLSLVQWLDDALAKNPRPTNLLVILIRYERNTNAPAGELAHGPVFQVTAPFTTLLNVRTAGQDSNAELLLDMLAEKWWDVSISRAYFEYNGPSALSWHLTRSDVQKIEGQAGQVTNTASRIHSQAEIVKTYLAGDGL